MRIVFDTNVLISAMLNPRGTPGAILALILAGEVVVLYDDRILAEYRDVLARPKLRIPPAEAELVLGFFEAEGVLTSAPPLPIDLPDPDDLPFLEVAVASRADALVTGNKRHFSTGEGTSPALILSPAEFLELRNTLAN